MNIKKAQAAAKAVLTAAMVIAVISLFAFKNEPGLQTASSVAAVILFIIGFYIIKTKCKCPYCGYDSIRKAFNRTVCPNCGRNLETGKKEKKVKRK